MPKRFTEPARHVMVGAQEEARALGHDYVGTEHLLLGLLLVEDGLAARTLDSLDITLDDVRGHVARIAGPVTDVAPGGEIRFTPRAEKAIDLAESEADALGHRFIATEHVLLGVTRVDDGVAARLLVDFGASPDAVRSAVLDMLSGEAPPPMRRAGGAPRRPGRRWEYRVEPGGDELDEARLNALGAEGWELVSTYAGPSGTSAVLKRRRA
jgi:ATP-dependent Clp protease ATP-binding subunit ClpC